MKTVFEIDDNVQYDLYEDLGWVTDFPQNMTAPSVRTNYKVIPGRNGQLDLTEIDGNLYYEDIEFTITAQRLYRTSEDIFTALSTLNNLFNGRRLKIILNDSEYYYDARVKVGETLLTGLNMSVSINIKAFPFRLQLEPTTVSVTLTSSYQEVTLPNGTMQLVPRITATGETTIEYENTIYTISSGTDITIPNLVLHEGDNTLQAKGSGTLTFTYTQGKF